ncbi:probable malonyl-CoA-acyl carrier protein transacylase, mitochondrial [Harpegnathos saltator]|uniref:Probable malonyl CoA-acyl carrier protein transacylase, mitochondrial n=1 Tax=Harpegnathos saltator TaxID=610380 RepID=E2B7J6_HARSA|nr:probable malonyl-CoA-acyl carrier protein transacylase, mitochondrial [Harpegnathos saltator]EFN88371.1 Probable malonyl CoA-acyl carrier protein transacylase, mitochondrial [Harpegnathos saltator]
MIQRTLSSKTIYLTRLLTWCRTNKFSDSTTTKDGDGPPNTNESQNESFANDFETTPTGEENVARLLKESATYSDAKDKNWSTSPYPAGVPPSVEDGNLVKPSIDPLDTCVILFPGQGTLKVGLVNKYLHFPQAKELFYIANEILNYNLLDLCLKGPQKKLDETRFNQPATVVASLAALEQLREERPRVFETCKAVAGYSVGELTSLIFSGVLSFEDGIRLVSVRGTAMEYASHKTPQGMMSVFCTPEAKVHEACRDAIKWARDIGVDNPICQVAIYLYTQSKILAGHKETLEYIEKNAKKYGLINLTKLPVSGAFHTKLMEPALKSFCKMFNTLEIDEPRCQVYSNYKGHMYGNIRLIRKYLPKQIVSPVKWEQTIQCMYNRPAGMAYPRTFDVGSGGRMKTILKLINTKAHEQCIAV